MIEQNPHKAEYNQQGLTFSSLWWMQGKISKKKKGLNGRFHVKIAPLH